MSESPGDRPAIRVRGLVKHFEDVQAVDGLDLEVYRGECFGLLGPNGAGKTTTIEILEGLLPPTGGEVEVLGLNWRQNAAELRARIGIQLQETLLYDKLSVEETVRLFRTFYEHRVPVDEVLASVDLVEKRAAWVGKLSGGQKQRLALALALVADPELVFLDEPTTGLDPTARRNLWELVRRLRVGDRTVLLTTHYMEEAEQLCDRIAIVDHGRVIALGTPRELIAGLGADEVVEIETEPRLPEGALCDVAGVVSTHRDGDLLQLTVEKIHVVLPAVLDAVRGLEVRLDRLTTRHATLDDVFLHLTGRTIEAVEAAEARAAGAPPP